MANNFDSNITRQLARVFLEKFETARVLSKNVNTQLLAGKFGPSTGSIVDFKRPTDYTSKRSADGDVSAGPPSAIITGKASGIVQDYFTVDVEYGEVEESLEMDQLDQLLAPMATRIVTDMELDFGAFMLKNAGLVSGTVGTPVTSWDHVARAGATMTSHGIPSDDMWTYAMNPFTQVKLSSDQRSLGAGGVAGQPIDSAHRKATLTSDFAGMMVMTSTALDSFTSADTAGNLTGTLASTPNGTYLAAKDSMKQTLSVTGIGTFGGTIPAGTVVQVGGRNRLNLSTRQPIVDELGQNVVWTATVTEDATLTGGAGDLVVTGPAINEAGGSYNTVDVALDAGDPVTILNADATLFQPNLFWHKQAFGIGSVPIAKLYSTDTVATTEDGIQIRVSKGADVLGNKQIVRFDLHPAYAVFNPFFAGQGWA